MFTPILNVAWQRSLLTVALLALLPLAAHAAAPPAAWRCAACGAESPWWLDLELAPAYVADDAYRFGDYTGLDDKGVYLPGRFAGRYFDDRARFLRFDGYALTRDALAFDLAAGRQGRYEISAAYQAIPRRYFDDTVTPFRGAGSSVLTLPESWVRAPVTAGMTDLADAADTVAIRRDWDVLELGLKIRPDSRWSVRSDYTHREREGRSRSSASFVFNGLELPSPVDYSSDDLELALAFSAADWEVELAYLGAFFDNGDDALTFDNPYSSPAGADAGALALPPDNESHQLALSGALRLPGRAVLSARLAAGTTRQDDALLPYTENPTLAAEPLPARSADMDADTLNLNVRALVNAWRRGAIEAEFRYSEFDVDKPFNEFPYVIGDSVLAPTPATNPGYDYERTELKLRGEYRLNRRLKLHAGLDSRRFERNAQERARTTTNRLWFRARQRLGPGADLDFDVFVEERTGSSYEPLDSSRAPQNPLLRKYNMADRDRYGLRLQGSLYPAERWDLGWELEYGRDEYGETTIGLTETKYARLGIDVSWRLGREGSLFAAVNTERVRAQQSASQRFDLPDWAATNSDRFDQLSLGFEHPRLFGPVGLKLAYDLADSRGEISSNTSGLASSFPDLTSRRRTFEAALDYQPDGHWTYGLHFRHEKLESLDWSLDGVGPVTVPRLLSLGADPFNYDVNVVYFSVRFRR